MDAGLLTKLFGSDWSGPCTVIIDADASIQTAGSDSAGTRRPRCMRRESSVAVFPPMRPSS